VLGDARIVDATITVTAGGAAVTTDTFTIPGDRAVQLDARADVSFLPVRFEAEGAPAAGPIPVDVRLTLSLLDDAMTLDAARSRITIVIGPVVGAASAVGADTIQAALAGEVAFVAIAAETVVSVEHLPGEFTEIRPGDAPFSVPAGGAFLLRDVTVTEAG
jgi:hypothetical protein